jgi:hypothetical protein
VCVVCVVWCVCSVCGVCVVCLMCVVCGWCVCVWCVDGVYVALVVRKGELKHNIILSSVVCVALPIFHFISKTARFSE